MRLALAAAPLRKPFTKTLAALPGSSGSRYMCAYSTFPGAPDYRALMVEQEGLTWRTVEHETHVEYQSLLNDLVLESEYLGVEAVSAHS